MHRNNFTKCEFEVNVKSNVRSNVGFDVDFEFALDKMLIYVNAALDLKFKVNVKSNIGLNVDFDRNILVVILKCGCYEF